MSPSKSDLESSFLQKLDAYVQKGILEQKYCSIFKSFFFSYKHAMEKANVSKEEFLPLFHTLLTLIIKQLQTPYAFSNYHKKIQTSFDYYQFGLDFFRPLIDLDHSLLKGEKNLDTMQKLLKKKENVILLANHQTEVDPQALSLILEKKYDAFAKNIIYVAGERVLLDPLASPFSLGCDLLCVYSKKYLDVDLKKKREKQLYNRKTMDHLRKLLSEGEKIIYIAPSGGRDRKNEKGVVEVAPFDPQSIQMLYLMTKKATLASHFFPLALHTYDLLPPPDSLQIEMGEKRTTKKASIFFSFGEEIDMRNFPDAKSTDKRKRRKSRADYIHNLVQKAYDAIKKEE